MVAAKYGVINQSKVVLFGGFNESWNLLEETWEYDFDANIWTEIITSTQPSARDTLSMVYDSTNEVVVLFGGFDLIGPSDETWEYDVNTQTWSGPILPATRPSGRAGAEMAFDSSSGSVVLFGGTNGFDYFSDTWTYNSTTNTWTNRTPLSPIPNRRATHRMIYDSTDDVTLLFGGYDGTNPMIPIWYGDTWEYDYTLNSWTNITNPAASPSAREHHGMAYSSGNDKTILFGGKQTIPYNDTWIHNQTADWAPLPVPTSPPARDSHRLVYDSVNDVGIIFGGLNSSSHHLNDTWTLEPITYYVPSGVFESSSFNTCSNGRSPDSPMRLNSPSRSKSVCLF